MGLKQRIRRLEALHVNIESLEGVLIFHPELIYVDGKPYTSIEDVPSELREKYPDLLVGRVDNQHGRTRDIFA